MFLEQGCPPRVPEKTDLLFEIKILKIVEVGDESALEQLDEITNETPFEAAKKTANEVRTTATAMFRQGNFNGATGLYQRAIQGLELCNLKDENEQKEQQDMLISLYRNLAIAFNKRNLPKKACSAVNDLKRLTNIYEDSKIMFAQGKALSMLGEFEKAKKSLCTALRLSPNNADIVEELEMLEKKAKKHKETELAIARNAFKMVAQAEEIQKKKKEREDEFEQNRRKGIKNELIKFKDSKNDRLDLPDSFNVEEIEMVQEIANELEIKLKIDHFDKKESYYLAKN